VDLRDNWCSTPPREESQFGLLEISRVLVDHGAYVNARQLNRWTLNHWTPILISASFGHLEVVKLLLERGADSRALSSEGETPLQLSLKRGHRGIADLLRNYGAGRARLEQIFYGPNAMSYSSI
jgi:ankyrin repeat protein